MLKSSIKKIIDKIQKQRVIRYFYKPLKAKYDRLEGKKTLTRAQKREIRAFYKELTGERIPLVWHKFLYSRTGIYSKKYLPTSLYKATLLYRANRYGYRDAYADKNMAEVYLPDVKHPETLLKNMNGYYYVGGKPVTKEEAVAFARNIDDVIIKPSLESHGDGVHRLTVRDGVTNVDGLTIDKLFDRYKEDFLIQRRIHQHERMNALNDSSVNTIRVFTYRRGMDIIVLYTVIRIGRAGSDIDNESAGGISAKINPDGTLAKYAFGNVGADNVEKTDSGIVLEGYAVPSYHEAVETVKRLHLQLPFFNLIGWDVAIEESGEPVLIEWNICTELSQSANGPAFGEHTESIIRELMQRPNHQNPNW